MKYHFKNKTGQCDWKRLNRYYRETKSTILDSAKTAIKHNSKYKIMVEARITDLEVLVEKVGELLNPKT